MIRLRLVALCIALVLAAAFGWRLAGSPGFGLWRADVPPAPVAITPRTPRTPRDAMMARLAESPEYAGYFDRLQASFPLAHGQILTMLAHDFESAAAGGKPPASIDLQVFQASRMLRQSRGVLAAKAEAELMRRIFDAQASMMQSLASDGEVKLCVDFFYGGAAQNFFDYLALHRRLSVDLALTWLEAIGDGKANPVMRPDPDDADFKLLEEALAAKGLPRIQIDALLDGKPLDKPVPDADMCQAVQSYLATLRALPQEPQIRLLARTLVLAARS